MFSQVSQKMIKKNALDNSSSTFSVSIDLPKALDTVNDEILLSELNHYKIT